MNAITPEKLTVEECLLLIDLVEGYADYYQRKTKLSPNDAAEVVQLEQLRSKLQAMVREAKE